MCIKSRVETLAHYRAGPTIDLNANCKMNLAGKLPFFCHNFTTTGPIERERDQRERERELGTEFYSKNPTPNGSRPSDLIGHYTKWQRAKRPQPAKRSSREEGGGDRGSTAARPTLTRNWGGPQVRDPAPIVSVNPEADPPQPRAPVRPRQGEQDGETAEEKSQEHKKRVKGR